MTCKITSIHQDKYIPNQDVINLFFNNVNNLNNFELNYDLRGKITIFWNDEMKLRYCPVRNQSTGQIPITDKKDVSEHENTPSKKAQELKTVHTLKQSLPKLNKEEEKCVQFRLN